MNNMLNVKAAIALLKLVLLEIHCINEWIFPRTEIFRRKSKSFIDKLKHVPINWSNLKSKVDKLDVNKLVPVPVDLSKLSDVVKEDVCNAKI